MNEISENSQEEFKEIMTLGSELVTLAKQGNISEYQEKLEEVATSRRSFIFWHATQSLKKAIEAKHVEFVDFMINTIKIDLSHEAFAKFLHFIIVRTKNDTLIPEKEEKNRAIIRLALAHWKNVDEMDKTHENYTPLSLACFFGSRACAEELIDAGADINAVTKEDHTPVGLAGLRGKEAEIKNDEPMVEAMKDFVAFLKSKGGYENWRTKDQETAE